MPEKKPENENTEIAVSEAVAAELVAPPENVLAVQERASIDMQIATAHQYPRSLARFTQMATALATIDEETAESCIFRRPVGKDKKGNLEFAEGLSVRMAEIVGNSYGNIRVAGRIVERTPRYVKAEGEAIDLETNFYSKSEIIEPTIDRYGKPYSERMQIVIAKAAVAKARRDATFQVVPRALAKPVERAVRNLLYGDAKSLSKRRALVRGWIAKLGVEEERVFAALGIGGYEDMNEHELETLTGLKTAIKDGEIPIDEAFPPKQDQKVGLLEKKQPEKDKDTPPAAAEKEKGKKPAADKKEPVPAHEENKGSSVPPAAEAPSSGNLL